MTEKLRALIGVVEATPNLADILSDEGRAVVNAALEQAHPFLAGAGPLTVYNPDLCEVSEYWPPSRHLTLRPGVNMNDCVQYIAPDPTYFQTVLQ